MRVSQLTLMQTGNSHVNAIVASRYTLFFSYETPIVLVDVTRCRVYVNTDTNLSKTTHRHVERLIDDLSNGQNEFFKYHTPGFRNKIEEAIL